MIVRRLCAVPRGGQHRAAKRRIGVESDETAKAEVRAVLARSGIVLPEADVAFLAAQRAMLAETIRAVSNAAPPE